MTDERRAELRQWCEREVTAARIGVRFLEKFGSGRRDDIELAKDRERLAVWEALASLCAASEPTKTWQPIETAPQEGAFLVWLTEERQHSHVHAAYYHPNVKVIGNLFAFDMPPATHWMPLPSPPEVR